MPFHFQANPMKEAILEPWLRRMRIGSIEPYLAMYKECRLLDIGCGWEAKLLRAFEPQISFGIGIDLKAPETNTDKLKTLSLKLDNQLPFKDQSFDLITMLAVLEHLEHPLEILRECSRLLRPGGGLLLTVPSWYAKPVLEFMAFRLGIVNPQEISDHKRYYNRIDLFELFQPLSNLQIMEHTYFQWRFNNRLFAKKISTDTIT
jgi:2-polyprenyl-3-methyl-5-hydroxy-6-metoxy-1,4-benzoquinol methylase